MQFELFKLLSALWNSDTIVISTGVDLENISGVTVDDLNAMYSQCPTIDHEN